MSQHKSGLYRTARGDLLAVLVGDDPTGHRFITTNEKFGAGYTSDGTLEKAEYLGPAVIGDNSDSVVYWAQKANELHRSSSTYRRKWDEAKDEITRLTEELDATSAEIARLQQVSPPPTVEYSVDEDGLERYGFETVTVYRRGGREASCSKTESSWWPRTGEKETYVVYTREEAEAWCVKQLKPKWRKATVEDVAGKPECRVRVGDKCEWRGRTLLAHDDRALGGPWVTLDRNGNTRTWPICEVRK